MRNPLRTNKTENEIAPL